MTSREFKYCFCPYDGLQLERPSGHADGVWAKCPQCGFVDYPNPKPCIGVIIEHAGRILLARRGEEPKRGMYDIPGGFVENGETVEAAVAREITEETSLQLVPAPAGASEPLRPGEFRYFASFPDEYGPHRTATVNLMFIAQAETDRFQAGSDVAELQWHSVDAVPTDLAFVHQQIAMQRFLGLYQGRADM